MRNKYGGPCYRCQKHVPPGTGHFERYHGHWRLQHANCCLMWRAKDALDDLRLELRAITVDGVVTDSVEETRILKARLRKLREIEVYQGLIERGIYD